MSTLAPGFLPTRMTGKIVDRITPRVDDQAPLGRLGRPGELARGSGIVPVRA